MAATGATAGAAGAPLAAGPQLQLVLVVGASYGEQLAAQLQATGANVIPCLQPQVTLQALQLVSQALFSDKLSYWAAAHA
jgi:cysteine synthase